MIDIIKQPWSWYVAGPLFAIVMISMYWLGEKFGVSSTCRSLCSLAGADKLSDYFKMDNKASAWNFILVIGALVGGFIASHFLSGSQNVILAPNTINDLQQLGIKSPGENFLPTSIFSWQGLLTLKGFIIIVGGGFLVGFGSRYADGCTSGHAITGLSTLQLPSLIAVIGFFIGGLISTFILLPLIFKL